MRLCLQRSTQYPPSRFSHPPNPPSLFSSFNRYVLSRIQGWIDEDTWTFSSNTTEAEQDEKESRTFPQEASGETKSPSVGISPTLGAADADGAGARREVSFHFTNVASKEEISAALERSFAEDEEVDKGMIRVLRHSTYNP